MHGAGDILPFKSGEKLIFFVAFAIEEMRGHYWDEITGYDSNEDHNAAVEVPTIEEIATAIESSGRQYSFTDYLDDWGYLDAAEEMLGLILVYSERNRLPLLQTVTLTKWMQFLETCSHTDWHRTPPKSPAVPPPIPLHRVPRWKGSLTSLGTIPRTRASVHLSEAGKKRSTASATL